MRLTFFDGLSTAFLLVVGLFFPTFLWGADYEAQKILENAFRFQLAGVERQGFLDASGAVLSNVKTAIDVREYPSSDQDAFPREPVEVRTQETFDEAGGLKITCETTTYADYPCCESVVWFENVSDVDSPNLKDVVAVDVLLPTGGDAKLTSGYGEESDPKRNYLLETVPLTPGEPRSFTPREAYPSFGAFPYFVVEGRERSYIVAIGWTGRWTATFESNASGDARFVAGQKDVDLYLKPGEKIRTPRITLFAVPTGSDLTNLWRDWFRRYVMPRQENVVLRPKFVLDVFYRGELYDKVTADEQIDAIRKLRALGYPCEGLWIDAGWYLREGAIKTFVGYWFAVGDWTLDPARFPKGLRPVADELANVAPGEKKGDLVLWFEPERVYKDNLNDENRKYVVPDKIAVESYRMNLTSDETVDYLSKKIGDMIRTNGVSIYRQDSNGAGPLVFLESLEEKDPNFNDRKGYAENRYVCGLYRFWENLKAQNPDLVFDTCASGGRRNDLETLRLGAVPLHYSDVGYFDFVEKQRCHDALNRWFVYYKNIDPHDFNFEKDEYDVYKTTIDVAPFSTVRPYFLENPNPSKRNYADRYFAVRELLVDGDYYLLQGGFTENDWSVWQFDDSRQADEQGSPISKSKDAVARFAKDAPLTTSKRQSGCVFCVRNEKNDEESFVVKPRQIDPTGVYRWENLETRESTTISGATLATEGVEVFLPKRSAVSFKYSRIE